MPAPSIKILFVDRLILVSEVIALDLLKMNAKQWVYVGGVALLAGMWVAPRGVDTMPENVAVPPAAEQQVIQAPTATAKSSPQAPRTHIGAAGDTLLGIAEHYGIDLETITAANPDISDLIHP
ncbi:MAG: LysM peptidoglycan-binding domain-containing protein, partial [Sporomusa sp.]